MQTGMPAALSARMGWVQAAQKKPEDTLLTEGIQTEEGCRFCGGSISFTRQ